MPPTRRSTRVPEGSQANKIVVISDLHLGVDDAYSETVKNRPLLVEFIHGVAVTDDIAEVGHRR